MAVLTKAFERIGFQGAVRIGLMDKSHILIRFDMEKDYSRCFCRRTWLILGYPMRVTKYTFDFHPCYDALIVPVWISLPGLPVYLHHQSALFAIAAMIGTPIRSDAATQKLLRPSVPHVCIEVDVSNDLPQNSTFKVVITNSSRR